MQKLIGLLLDSPISSKEPIIEINGDTAIEDFKKANVDVKTRILLQAGMDAMKGDRQWAEFLFKYGGLEPVKEQHTVMEGPMIIDDLGGDPAPSEGAPTAAEPFIPTEIYDDPRES